MAEVVIVNERDEELGFMEKMEAHKSPHLHRAFSVFIFNREKKLLLQQRAFTKYHSGGLWTNTCCSHPFPGEVVEAAAHRRLHEELGLSTELTKAFDFIYNAEFDNGLFEHEFDHVFVGEYEGPVYPNPSEVAAYCFKSIACIKRELELSPAAYTPWFKIALPLLESYLEKRATRTAVA